MNRLSKLPDKEILAMFDSTEFRGAGHVIIELLADYLDKSIRGEGKVISWQVPQQAIKRWQKPLPIEPALSPREFVEALDKEILDHTLRIHHPHNLGHQVATPLPVAALCDLVASLTNQAMTVYEAGPSATLLEKQVVQWLCELIGWEDSDGVLTSGGAQANLTALLAARQIKAGWDTWQQGVSSGSPLRILACETTHYSVSRAAGIMGLGTDAVIKVPMDKLGRMDISALKEAYQQCRHQNVKPFAVTASAGCTPTGSVDPLIEIGTFCREHDLWFHVDGAHGASALLSSKFKPMLAGIELADSVVWDGHKLLYMPAAVSAVLFRKAEHSYAAFAQEASYLFSAEDPEEAYNLGTRTLECTKRMMGLKLWAAFMLYGTAKLGGLVEHVFETAKQLALKLEETPEFALLMQPQTNIVCFRLLPVHLSKEELDRHQEAVRKKLVEQGQFHLTQVKLGDQVWLRTTVMNPLTSGKEIMALIQGISLLQ